MTKMKMTITALAILAAVPAMGNDRRRPIEHIMNAANIKEPGLSECERATVRVNRLKQLGAVASVRLMQAKEKKDDALASTIRGNLKMITGAYFLAADEEAYRCKQ